METSFTRRLTRMLAAGGTVLAVAMGCALPTLAASAADGEGGGERQWRAQERERRQEAQQAIEQGAQRQGDRGNASQYRPDSPPPRDRNTEAPGRLTPEERRALRRQIYEGGREVYPSSERR